MRYTIRKVIFGILALTRSSKRDSKPSHRRKSAANSGNIRVIAGQWRGRKLPVLDAQGLRPTTDRTKETVFNWLMQAIPGARCLDLFSGSGGLGIEALSRYAEHVVMIEKSQSTYEQLRKNIISLKVSDKQCSLLHQDGLAYLNDTSDAFDIIFLDPPFNQQLLQPAIKSILERNVLNTGGLIYIESEKALADIGSAFNLNLRKQKTTDQVAFSLWEAD